MANYNNLKDAIKQVIKQNGNQEITGNVLQNSLISMINSLGDGYQFIGVATPSTNPGTPDQKVFYIASQSGTYSNFGGVEVSFQEIKILYYNGSWNNSTLSINAVDGIYTALSDSFNNVNVYYNKIVIKKEGFSLWIKNKYCNIQGNSDYVFTAVAGKTRTWLCLDSSKINSLLSNSSYNWDDISDLLVVISDSSIADKYLILASTYGTTIQPKGYLFESLPLEIGNNFCFHAKVRNSVVEVDGNKIYLSFENISFFGKTIKNSLSLPLLSTRYGIELIQSPSGKSSILIEDEKALVYSFLDDTFKILDYLSVDFHYLTILGNYGGQYWSALDSIMQNAINDNSEIIKELQARSVNTKKDALWRCYQSAGKKPYTISSVGNVASDIIAVDGKVGDTIYWRYFDNGNAVGTTMNLYLLDSNGEYVEDYTGFAGGKRTITTAKEYSYIVVSANAPTLNFNPLLSINNKIIWTSYYADYIQDDRISDVEEKGGQISLLYSHFLDTTYLCTELDYIPKYRAYINDDTGKIAFGADNGINYVKLPYVKNKNIVIYNIYFTPSSASALTYLRFLAVDENDTVIYSVYPKVSEQNAVIQASKIPDNTSVIYLDFPSAHTELALRYVDNFSTDTDSDTGIISLNDKTKTLNWFKNITRELKGRLTQTQKQCVFLHFSDMHQSKDNLTRVMQYATYYSTYIDDVLFSGDSVANSFNQVSDTDYKNYWDGSNAQNALFCIGNHDTSKYDSSTGYTPTEYAGVQAYNRYIKPYVSNWGVVQPDNAEANGYCYYYKDYTDKKVRVIFLDVMDAQKDITPQKTWFVATLASAKTANLSVVCVCHFPVSGNDIDCTFNCLSPKYSAYAPNLQIDFVNAVKDFIDDGGDFVCYLSGDTHIDFFGTAKTDDRQASVVVSTSSGYSGQQQFDNIERVPETKSQDLFNIIGVDTYHGWFTVFRVGADTDSSLRHIGTLCYDYRNKKLLYND